MHICPKHLELAWPEKLQTEQPPCFSASHCHSHLENSQRETDGDDAESFKSSGHSQSWCGLSLSVSLSLLCPSSLPLSFSPSLPILPSLCPACIISVLKHSKGGPLPDVTVQSRKRTLSVRNSKIQQLQVFLSNFLR